MSILSLYGRNGDTEIAHVSPGELVVPREAQTPELKREFAKSMLSMGTDPARYVVGPQSSVNPYTGKKEFFLDSLFEGIGSLFGEGGIGSILQIALPSILGFASGNPMAGMMSLVGGAMALPGGPFGAQPTVTGFGGEREAGTGRISRHRTKTLESSSFRPLIGAGIGGLLGAVAQDILFGGDEGTSARDLRSSAPRFDEVQPWPMRRSPQVVLPAI